MAKTIFSDKIVESDAFLDMPLTAQALYFHLGMNADNDGFVNPRRIMRMIGAANDDLQILLAKRFLLGFDSGVVVIKHWWINNTKRADRHVGTTYQNELGLLAINDNRSYSEITTEKVAEVVQITDTGNQMATNIQPKVAIIQVKSSQVHVQSKSSQVNTNQDGVARESTKDDKKVSSKSIDGMFDYWEAEVGYKITGKAKQNREYCGKLLKDYSRQEIALMVKGAALASEDQYAPGISNFIDLYRKWDALKLWGKKRGKQGLSKVGVVE